MDADRRTLERQAASANKLNNKVSTLKRNYEAKLDAFKK